MPSANIVSAVPETGASKSFWTIVQGFFMSTILGCIFCDKLKKPSARGYIHYFPEGDGFLYITHVGSGNQGAALLVRSVSDQQNYVRKRKKFPSVRFPASNEAEFALAHDNIPQCILQTPYQGLDGDGFRSQTTADIFTYCNGGNLQRVLDIAREKKIPVPSALIWRLFRQLLGVLIFLSSNKILHRDIKADNIFLHWKKDAALPDFFLGDFGIACRPGHDFRGHARTMDFVKLVDLVKLCVMPAAPSLSPDPVPVPPSHQGGSFAALDRSIKKFRDVIFDYSRDFDADVFETALRELMREMEQEGALWEQEMKHEVLGEYRVEVAKEPQVFATEEALLVESFPPGPWQVAEVVKKRGVWTVKKIGETRYCENKAEFT